MDERDGPTGEGGVNLGSALGPLSGRGKVEVIATHPEKRESERGARDAAKRGRTEARVES